MVTDEVEELRINYEYNYEDYKITSLPLLSKASLVIIGVIPICILVIIEAILILIFYKSGFSLFEIYVMVLFPGIYLFIVILYIPVKLIVDRNMWKSFQQLPLERKWIFNSEGITFSNAYSSTLQPWNYIHKVIEMNNSLFFHFTNNRILNFSLEPLPFRVLTEEQKEKIKAILLNKIDNSKIKFRTKIK